MGGSRTYHLEKRYGITAADADAMLAAQGGLCAMCGVAAAEHVDHETGGVRALLCSNCNGGLGQFKEERELLRAAARHVERHRSSPRSVSSRRQSDDPRGRRRPGVSRDRRCSPGFARWRAMHAST